MQILNFGHETETVWFITRRLAMADMDYHHVRRMALVYVSSEFGEFHCVTTKCGLCLVIVPPGLAGKVRSMAT